MPLPTIADRFRALMGEIEAEPAPAAPAVDEPAPDEQWVVLAFPSAVEESVFGPFKSENDARDWADLKSPLWRHGFDVVRLWPPEHAGEAA